MKDRQADRGERKLARWLSQGGAEGKPGPKGGISLSLRPVHTQVSPHPSPSHCPLGPGRNRRGWTDGRSRAAAGLGSSTTASESDILCRPHACHFHLAHRGCTHWDPGKASHSLPSTVVQVRAQEARHKAFPAAPRGARLSWGPSAWFFFLSQVPPCRAPSCPGQGPFHCSQVLTLQARTHRLPSLHA